MAPELLNVIVASGESRTFIYYLFIYLFDKMWEEMSTKEHSLCVYHSMIKQKAAQLGEWCVGRVLN